MSKNALSQTASTNLTRRLQGLAAAFVLGLAALGTATTASAGPFGNIGSAIKTTAAKAKAAAPAPKKVLDAANPAAILEKIEKAIDSLPKPGQILGDAKQLIDENIRQTVDQLVDMQGDLQRFKGPGCGINQGSDCAVLKRRLKGIYTNLRGIRDIVPGYDFLPDPADLGFDPMGDMIDKIPAAPLFGMSAVFANLSVLDDIEMISEWVDQLRFYLLIPIEEDIFYRLDAEECMVLEESILADNEIFDRMMKVMNVTSKVSGIAADILPRDITVVVAGGTAIPNPILPVMVLSESMSTDFHKLLEQELEERGTLVKKCRTQEFRNDVQDKLDILVGD